ncbi:hypothetical protein D3C72_660370 [compost metagenome]
MEAELAALLNEFALAAAMGNGLADYIRKPLGREGRFDLLLDLAGNVFKLAITDAIIDELALFDQGRAGDLSHRIHEAV